MSTETNLSNLDADTVDRVDHLAAGTARRTPKDGGALRAARREQAAARKRAKSPAAEKPKTDATKLTLTENRAVKRAVVDTLRGMDFAALSKGVEAYPELKGVKVELMRNEINRHCRYLVPKTDAK